MKLKPEELTENNYKLLDQMPHKDLISFVKAYLNKKTLASSFFYFSMIASFGVMIFFFMKFLRSGNISVSNGINHVLLGIALTFTLIPIHEFIHVLAYKSQGAKQTSYDYNLKKFYFLAIAHRFVANKKEFAIVALSPFVIISSTLITISFFTSHLWTITLLSILMTHSTLCTGDFALLSYFEFNKDKEVVTYDDKENKISFFLGKEK